MKARDSILVRPVSHPTTAWTQILLIPPNQLLINFFQFGKSTNSVLHHLFR